MSFDGLLDISGHYLMICNLNNVENFSSWLFMQSKSFPNRNLGNSADHYFQFSRFMKTYEICSSIVAPNDHRFSHTKPMNYFEINFASREKFVTKHRLSCNDHQTLITSSLENCFVSFFLCFSCHAQMQRVTESHPRGHGENFMLNFRKFIHFMRIKWFPFMWTTIVNYSARLDPMHKRKLDRIKVGVRNQPWFWYCLASTFGLV